MASIATGVACVVHRDHGHTADETQKSVLSWGMGKEAAIAPVPQSASCIETELEESKLCLPTCTLHISIDSHNCRGTCGWDERSVSWVTDGAGGRSG